MFHNQPTDLSVAQIKILFYCLLEGDDDMLNSGVFWSHILERMTAQRKKIVQHLWDNLNLRTGDRVSLVRFKNRFFAKFHPKVISGEKTAAQVEEDFLANIDFHGQIFGNTENFTEWGQFSDFMECWSATEENETRFLTTLVDCFRLSEFFGIYNEEIPDSQPIGLEKPKETGRNARAFNGSRLGRRDRMENSNLSRSGYGRRQRSQRSGFQQPREEPTENSIYGAFGRQSEPQPSRRSNFYDEPQSQVNLYQSNRERISGNRNYNIISGRNRDRQRPPDRSPAERKSQMEIRKNFYDQLQGKPDPRRDLSQKRRHDTDRRSHLSRSRRHVDKSPARSRIMEK